MMHPEVMRLMADEHVKILQRDARRRPRATRLSRRVDADEVELRLCRVGDDPELARLAELESRPIPFGRLIVAVVCGHIVAALPLGGGRPLADPFKRTAHILPLLELRAAQLREPQSGRRLLPRTAGLVRGTSGASR